MKMRDLYETDRHIEDPQWSAFQEQWGQYVIDLLPNVRHKLKAFYDDEKRWLLRQNGRTIYRGINVAKSWINAFEDGQTAVGVHWTFDRSVARGFSATTSSKYDNRFNPHHEEVKTGGTRVILTASLDLPTIDLNATIALCHSAHEEEVRFPEGAKIQVETILVGGTARQIQRDYFA